MMITLYIFLVINVSTPKEEEKEGGKGEQRKTKRKICKEGKQKRGGLWNKPSWKKCNVCENIQYIFFVSYKVRGFYTPIFPESLHVVTSGSEKNGIHI